MRRVVIIALLVCGLYSCNQFGDAVSGKPYDILKPEVYNDLQKQYSSIADYELGTAIVLKDTLYGLINSRGKEVLPCQYDTIYPLQNNMRIVGVNNMFGMVDARGNVCISCTYEETQPTVSANYFPFKRNGKWGFLTKSEEIATQFKYDEVSQLTDTTFIAKLNGKSGLFTYTNKCILDIKYDRIVYKVLNKPEDPSYVYLNDKVAILNSRNEFVTDFEYSGGLESYVFPQEGKYVEVSKIVSSRYRYNRYRYGLIEYETGKIVIPCEYEELGDISEGLLYAKKDDKYGYIDINNNVVIPFKYEDAVEFSEGLARVAVHGGYYNSKYAGVLPYNKYGFIDKTGQFVIPPTFPNPMLNEYDAKGFHEGLAAMGKRPDDNVLAHYFGYIDTKGKYVIAPVYDKAHRFMHGVALVRKNDKYGCIDKEGNVIVDLIYDDYEYRSEKDTIITLKKGNQKYSFHFDGTPLQ